MTSTSRPRRRARGEIETLPSGSLRVRVYAGLDPVTGKRRYLVETVPAGPNAAWEAEGVRARLLQEVRARRDVRAWSTADPSGDRWPADGGGRPAPADAVPPSAGPDAAWLAPSPARRGRLTVSAIARLAGVSAPTVSKVLNGRPGVAEETRRRVEHLLDQHGYRHREGTGGTSTVEVVFHGMLSAVAIDVLSGVEHVVREHRLSVGFTDLLRHPSIYRSWAEELADRRPVGAILVHLGQDAAEESLRVADTMPMVALDPVAEPPRAVPRVGAGNLTGAIAAARHLTDLGHRRIAVITGPADRLAVRARLEGTRTALAAAGVGLDDRLVRSGWFTFGDGLGHGRDLLQLSERPTAVLCGNDLQALGVYEAAREAGIRIPEDLSVVGFDDVSHGLWCGPPLTTVRQPFGEMGATAARMVLAMAAGRRPAQTRVEHATTLVVRGSTAPPGGRARG